MKIRSESVSPCVQQPWVRGETPGCLFMVNCARCTFDLLYKLIIHYCVQNTQKMKDSAQSLSTCPWDDTIFTKHLVHIYAHICLIKMFFARNVQSLRFSLKIRRRVFKSENAISLLRCSVNERSRRLRRILYFSRDELEKDRHDLNTIGFITCDKTTP